MSAQMQRYRGSLLGLAVGDALGTTLAHRTLIEACADQLLDLSRTL